MNARLTIALCLAVAVGAASCSAGQGCDSYAAASLVVRVIDSNGGEVCDASVIATKGPSSVTLEPYPGPPCEYFGPHEVAGTFDIEAISGSARATAPDVEVGSDACHVITENVVLRLED